MEREVGCVPCIVALSEQFHKITMPEKPQIGVHNVSCLFLNITRWQQRTAVVAVDVKVVRQLEIFSLFFGCCCFFVFFPPTLEIACIEEEEQKSDCAREQFFGYQSHFAIVGNGQ